MNFNQFNSFWDQQMVEFDQEPQKVKEQTQQRHEDELRQFSDELENFIPVKPKDSAEILALRKTDKKILVWKNFQIKKIFINFTVTKIVLFLGYTKFYSTFKILIYSNGQNFTNKKTVILFDQNNGQLNRKCRCIQYNSQLYGSPFNLIKDFSFREGRTREMDIRKTIKIRNFINQLRHKQINELNALTQRILSGQEEQRKIRSQELEILLQKYQNVRKELESQQVQEITRLDKSCKTQAIMQQSGMNQSQNVAKLCQR